MSACEHDWRRAPERDRVYGHHWVQGPLYSVLVFWCAKCLATETRRVEFVADTAEGKR